MVEVEPLPKSHFQEVTLPVDLSWKFTIIGAHPLVAFDVKSAMGLWAHKHRVTNKDDRVRNKVLVFNFGCFYIESTVSEG